MKLLLVNNLEPEDIEFNQPLYESLPQFAAVDSISYAEPLSAVFVDQTYDAVVISGAPLDYDTDVLQTRLPYLRWIKETNVPVLGICLGHQNIALMYGARAMVNTEAENEAVNLVIKETDDLLSGITHRDKLIALHSCSVSLPEGFTLLASTKNCNNQVMKHVEKPLYSMQFHPELSESGIKILKNFIRIAELSANNTK